MGILHRLGLQRPDQALPESPRPGEPAATPLIGIKEGRADLDGEAGIRALGHREQIGGHWDEIGKLQYDFMVGQGLKPSHYYLDIACGSLRGGVHLIPYLDPGHYLGMDKESLLIELGVSEELGPELAAEKRPEFVVSSTFEFDRFSVRPDYALAQSLFTHLPADAVATCLRNLRPQIADGGTFFATFNRVDEEVPNPSAAHDWGNFRFTVDTFQAIAEGTGWAFHYLGDWGHPRGQVMARFTPT